MDPDAQYLASLKQNNIAYSEPSAAENLGRSLCFAMRAGEPMWMILRIVESAGTYNPHDSAVIVGASVNAYCPEYLAFIQQYAQDHPDG
jgi:hypothetical protein